MSRVVLRIWRTMLLELVLALLLSPEARALSFATPEPIAISFQARTDQPTPAGVVALDSLAVRAAQCPVDKLAVHLQAAANADGGLTRRRLAAVQRHMDGLGIRLAVEMQPVRSNGEQIRPPRKDVLLADVGAGDDYLCFTREGTLVFGWAQDLARHVEDKTQEAPAFWRLLSPSVRSHELAQSLAAASYCEHVADCRKHPLLYPWLAEQALGGATVAARRSWLLELWVFADDEEVERFRKRWALAPLTAEQRAQRAVSMASGDLPWPLVEQRLLAPGVMKRLGDLFMLGGGQPDRLLWIASRRGELDSFDRLIDAAGPAKACFVDDAFRAAAEHEDEFNRLKPHFAAWSRGLAGPYRPKGGNGSCNPVATVLVGAFCKADRAASDAARYEDIWALLRQARVSVDSPAVRPLVPPEEAIEPWQCKLEAVPGSAARFRAAPASTISP